MKDRNKSKTKVLAFMLIACAIMAVPVASQFERDLEIDEVLIGLKLFLPNLNWTMKNLDITDTLTVTNMSVQNINVSYENVTGGIDVSGNVTAYGFNSTSDAWCNNSQCYSITDFILDTNTWNTTSEIFSTCDNGTFHKNDSHATFARLESNLYSSYGNDSLQWVNNSFLKFDGNVDIVNISQDISQASTGSISAWVKLDDIDDGYHSIIAWKENIVDTNNYGSFRIQDGNAGAAYDGTIQFVMKQGASVDVNAYTVNRLYDDIWYHIVATHNGTGITIYIDGVQQAITYLTGTPSATEWWDDFPATGTNWFMGSVWYNNAIVTTMTGNIDDVILWDRILSTAEVVDLYNDGKNHQTYDNTNLLAHYTLNGHGNDETGTWDIDDLDGTTFIDEIELRSDIILVNIENDLTVQNLTTTGNLTLTDGYLRSNGDLWITADNYNYMQLYNGDIIVLRDIISAYNKSLNLGNATNFFNKLHVVSILYGSPFFDGNALEALNNTKAKAGSVSNDWGKADVESYPEGFRIESCWNETTYKNETILDPTGIPIIIKVPIITEKCEWKLSAFDGIAMLLTGNNQLYDKVTALESKAIKQEQEIKQLYNQIDSLEKRIIGLEKICEVKP